MSPEETWKVADSLFYKWLDHPDRRHKCYDVLEMDPVQHRNLTYLSYNFNSEMESRQLESDTKFVDAQRGSRQLIYRGSLIVKPKMIMPSPTELYAGQPSPDKEESHREFYMAILMFTEKGRYVYLDWEKNPPNWV